jgi:hypothetical protein
MSGNVYEAFTRWIDQFSSYTSLNGVKLKSEAATSSTKKWHHWRVKLAGGSKISINFLQKTKDKILLQVNHDNLLNEVEALQWKNFWRKKITEFGTA